MAKNIFNLYSATVFADHPIALWNLDDDFSYLSLISASPMWNIIGGSSSSTELIKTKPGETVGVADADIIIKSFTGSSSSTLMKTHPFNSDLNIDRTKDSVCISSFIYSSSGDIDSIHIGFEYIDPETLVETKLYKQYTNIPSEQWIKIENTKSISDDLEINAGDNVSIYPYIKIFYDNGATTRKYSLYNFSVGQWSEEYNSETEGSVGIPLTQVSASSQLISMIGGIYSLSPQLIKVLPIDSYSLDDTDFGYYIIENNKMLATNTKLPMVFGSGNITEIYPSNYGNPSIVFPGEGFLNNDGKYRELTLEFWLRIDPDISTDFRILGPLDTQDGLYVRDGFLILKIGPYEKSYFVGKWYRPMLIDIIYNQLFANVLINGETVIEITMNPRDVSFPSNIPLNRDWIGFYSHEFITKFEIDCIAIYPYRVSEQIAKKKFVIGQGVGKSDDIVRRFSGQLTNVDFSFAKYTNTISYPVTAPWSSGYYSNVETNSKFLSLPSYTKPSINYIGDDLSIFSAERFQRRWSTVRRNPGEGVDNVWNRWVNGLWRSLGLAREAETLYDNYFSQSNIDLLKHIVLRPSSIYKDLYGSINFPSINMIADPTASIHAIFSLNQNELNAAINDAYIQEMTLLHMKNNATGDSFRIYVDKLESKIIYKFNTSVIYELPITVDSTDKKFAVGIDIENISREYFGVVKNFFLNSQNISFSIGGNEKNMFTGKIYKVVFNNRFFTNKDLSSYFNPDGIINSAAIVSMLQTNGSSFLRYIGNYTLLFKKTNDTMIMDIGTAGYWEDSIPLASFGAPVRDADGNVTKYELDLMQFNIDYPSPYASKDVSVVSNINIDSYVTLKKNEDVGFTSYLNYTNTKELSNERVIDFENGSIDVDNTKFRIIDNTVIFSPKSIVNFNDACVTIHLEIKSNASSTEPIILNKMSISSLAYDELSLYGLGSLTGNKIYPFVRQGYSYSNKVKNPFIFYKESMPYLYLTGDSGISAVPYSAVDNSPISYVRGLSMPINPSKLQQYSLYGLHMWMNYNEDYSFSSQKKIMTILLTNNQKLNIYLTPTDNQKRAKLQAYLLDGVTETEYTNIKFYQNGILLTSPYIRPLTWSMITFSFTDPIQFGNFIGQIEIHPGVLFNNIAIYESSIENKVDDIFESHLGLSNIVAEDDSTLYINYDNVKTFTDIEWSFFSGKVV